MRIAVLADTHIPKRAKTLPQLAWDTLRSADVILHAGDVLTNQFLIELKNIAPLYAVRGNNDAELTDVPDVLEFELEGVCFGMIHDSGQKSGRRARMRKQFPNANVVVFGHSHIPINQYENELLLFNPGSATDRRMQPDFTMGLLKLNKGKIYTSEIIVLPKAVGTARGAHPGK